MSASVGQRFGLLADVLGYSGVRRRAVTQTVWGDDICPVTADAEEEEGAEAEGGAAAAKY